MKILFILLINVVFYFIAIIFKHNFLKKINLYKSIILYISDINSQISFNKLTYKEIFNNNKNSYSSYFNNVFENLLKSNSKSFDYLKDFEINEINVFLKSLGKYDIISTKGNLEFYINKFKNKIEVLENDYKNKILPIFKIIIILGVALTILLI